MLKLVQGKRYKVDCSQGIAVAELIELPPYFNAGTLVTVKCLYKCDGRRHMCSPSARKECILHYTRLVAEASMVNALGNFPKKRSKGGVVYG